MPEPSPPWISEKNKMLGGILQNKPNVFDEAVSKYPIIQKYGIKGKVSPNARGGFLEFWPPDESGPPDYPRPKEFGNSPGVEIYRDDTRPIDVLGDVTSHWLIDQDPRVKGYYQQFQNTMTPQQRDILQEQYQYAQQNQGEKRPYADWEQASGMPGYFRGYAFEQWPRDEKTMSMYTPDQISMFDEMMKYLGGGK